MAFDPSKYGATPVPPSNSSSFDPSKYGAVAVQKTPEKPKDNRDTLQKIGDAVNKIFPGKKLGQSIGTLAGYIGSKNKENYDLSAPKPKEVIGDAVQSVASVVPGVGPLTRVGLGYASDVAANFANGKEKNKFAPGFGTAFSVGAEALGPVFKSLKTISKTREANAIEKIYSGRAKEIADIENNYASIRRVTAGNKGDEAKKILAKTNLLPEAVDATGTINTKPAIEQWNKEFLQPYEDVVKSNLKNESKTIPIKAVQNKLAQAIEKSGLELGAKGRALQSIEADIKQLILDHPDGKIPLEKIHSAKVDKYANINYLNPESKRADKAVAKALKEIVESNTQSVDVKQLNKELSQYYAVQKLLETLDGKKVKGGKLGKYFAQGAGAVIGSKLGPLGSIAGTEIGALVHGAKMKSTFGRKVGEGIGMEVSDAMKKARALGNTKRIPVNSLPTEYTNELPVIPFGKSPKVKSNLPVATESPNVLPQYSFGNRKINQSTTINNTTKAGIPESIPQKPKKGNVDNSQRGFSTPKAIVAGTALSGFGAVAKKAIDTLGKTTYQAAEPGAKVQAPSVSQETKKSPEVQTPKKYSREEVVKEYGPKDLTALPVKVKEETAAKIENKHALPKGALKTIMMMESTMGTDKGSADAGEMKWLTGLTAIALKDIKRKIDVNNTLEVLDATAQFYALLHKRYPKLSWGELYLKHYGPEGLPKDRAEKFDKLLSYYGE